MKKRLGILVLAATAAAAQTYTTLYSFPSYSGDGQNPLGVAVASSGVIYGATQGGGTGQCMQVTFGGSGCGTVFALTPPVTPGGAYTETILHNFTGQDGDGAFPSAGVVVGPSGELYGATGLGGNLGYGTVFELMPPAAAGGAWTEQVLYNLSSVLGYGQIPLGVVLAENGTLYVATVTGGVGYGSILQLTPPAAAGGAWTETDLYDFNGDTLYPLGNLIVGPGGVLIGAIQEGPLGEFGSIFELTPPATSGGAWTLSLLYNFPGGRAHGGTPAGGMALGTGGTLYGTTGYSGTSSNGNVFKLKPPGAGSTQWTEAVLYRFTGGSNGDDPMAPLTFAKDGSLYGTTSEGGDMSCDPD